MDETEGRSSLPGRKHMARSIVGTRPTSVERMGAGVERERGDRAEAQDEADGAGVRLTGVCFPRCHSPTRRRAEESRASELERALGNL